MSDLGQSLLDYLSSGQSTAGLGILFVSSLIEYVFPLFPGDTVTLFGAFLAANFEWSIGLVFAVTTLGSLAGAGIDYAVGRGLGLRPASELTGRRQRARLRVEPILEKFRRHGVVYVAINRFLPGIRALFFVAAGMAGLDLRKVLFWGFVSAAIWNGLIIGAGFAVGRNWERLSEMLRTYTTGAWVVIGVVVLGLVVRFFIRRLKSA